MDKQIMIRVPTEIKARLENLSAATHRPVAFYVREALLEHLEDLEDIYLADATMERVRAGKSELISTEQLSKNLGLDS